MSMLSYQICSPCVMDTSDPGIATGQSMRVSALATLMRTARSVRRAVRTQVGAARA
jgi:hypothetical protein